MGIFSGHFSFSGRDIVWRTGASFIINLTKYRHRAVTVGGRRGGGHQWKLFCQFIIPSALCRILSDKDQCFSIKFLKLNEERKFSWS